MVLTKFRYVVESRSEFTVCKPFGRCTGSHTLSLTYNYALFTLFDSLFPKCIYISPTINIGNPQKLAASASRELIVWHHAQRSDF